MDLKAKIERLRNQAPLTSAPIPIDQKTERLERLKSQLNQLVNRRREHDRRTPHARGSAPVAESHDLPGTVTETEHGLVHLVTHDFPIEHRHGSTKVGDAACVNSSLVAKLALNETFAAIDFDTALYFDTETTGLAGGTGTLPFLIGMGWFEAGRLHIEQLLLTAPGRERPILHRVAARLDKSTCLVTYNGKCFDWPLLCARFVLNRLPLPRALPHLDLLPIARRAFKRRLNGVRLSNVEEGVLGLARQDDIDGADIPGRYFSFLQNGDGALLAPVIEHNRHDVVALAALLGALTTAYRGDTQHQDARDQISLAQVAERAADHRQASVLAQRAADRDDNTEVSAEAWVLLARLYRRKKEYAQAVDALNQGLALVATDEEKAAFVHIMLAKIYEHNLKNIPAALRHAEQAISVEGEKRCRRLRMVNP